MSSLLRGDSPSAGARESSPPLVPPASARDGAGSGAWQRNTTLTVIAGVGVLLLAMGIGVLIGRAGAAKPGASAPPVITVAPSGSGAGSGASTEASFSSDWPSGTNGYTVQLQTLPESGTTVSAVEAAKSTASAKGASEVGALKSSEFTSLTAGTYIVYAGVYHARAEAEKAIGGLKKSFPGAKVIHVANGGSSGEGSSSSTQGGGSGSPQGGVGSSEAHPAPPSVLNTEKGKSGKSYEERSKELPDVVETG